MHKLRKAYINSKFGTIKIEMSKQKSGISFISPHIFIYKCMYAVTRTFTHKFMYKVICTIVAGQFEYSLPLGVSV